MLSVGALAGGLAVALDAAAAHALASILDPKRLSVLTTAVRLSEVHAVLLVAVALHLEGRADLTAASGPLPVRLRNWASVCLLLGLLLFGGGLSVYALSGTRMWVHLAPFGGLAWMAAWLLLALSSVRGRRS